MSAPALPFSLLDAARIVARGGTLDEKLAALSAHAVASGEAVDVVLLLHDGDAGLLLSDDGRLVLATADLQGDLALAITERTAIVTNSVPEALLPLLPDAGPCLLSPLLVEDEEGAFLEGLLVAGRPFASAPPIEIPEAILAISDLAAVAIRHARLRNAAWERSDHADQMLHTDRVTGLANRITFERMLELEIARAARQATPLAVVLLMVDDLPVIGQQHGSRVVEQVLRHVATAIADRVRLLDTVARFGEDEFAVIAPGDIGGVVALRLRDAIAEAPPLPDVRISVSAAVVHHPVDGTSGTELVVAAERGLAEARAAGRGTIAGVRHPEG